MSLIAFIKAFGIMSLYYLFKYGEFQYFTSSSKVTTKQLADAYIINGASLSSSSMIIKSLTDMCDSLNTFLENVFTNDAYLSIREEFYEIDPATGLKVLPDLIITLPNGLTLKIIDGEELQNFRINTSLSEWKGTSWPVGVGWILGLNRVAFRLKQDPWFSLKIPGTNTLNYFDEATQTVKPGTDFTPNRFLYDDDALYLAFYSTLITAIIKAFTALGFHKTILAWFRTLITKREFARVRNEIEELMNMEVDAEEKINKIEEFLTSLSTDHFSLEFEGSKLDHILKGRRLY